MKHIVYLISFLTLAIIGCSPEEEENPFTNSPPLTEGYNPTNKEDKDEENITQPSEDSRYYAKYEVYMPLGYSGQTSSRIISFMSENGGKTIKTSNSSWEGTYGPFKKGSKLYLKVEAEIGGIRKNVEYYVRLSVSRDKEPFVIKGEQRQIETSSLSTSYTIDF